LLSLSHAGDVSLHVYWADDGKVSAVLPNPSFNQSIG